MIKGSCLCQKVRYEIKELGETLIHCHCKYCQKNHSAAFSSNMVGKKRDFLIIEGKEFINQYESSPGKWRSFCSNCGTSLYHEKEDSPGNITIKVASIDEYPDFSTKKEEIDICHINCESDKDWVTYRDCPEYTLLKNK